MKYSPGRTGKPTFNAGLSDSSISLRVVFRKHYLFQFSENSNSLKPFSSLYECSFEFSLLDLNGRFFEFPFIAEGIPL